MSVGRERLLHRLERHWSDFVESFSGLPDNALLEPGVVGRWSVRDMLCHVSTWEDEFLKVLPLLLAAERLPRYGGIDAFNEREQRRKRALPLDQVRRDLMDTHDRLLAALASLPPTDGTTAEPLRRRLRWDTYGHYREHTAQIAAWRGVMVPREALGPL